MHGEVLLICCSQEVHIMHDFPDDFYGHHMKVVVLGYVRPQLDYTSRGTWEHALLPASRQHSHVEPEALIEDIETDKKVALTSMARPAYQTYTSHTFFHSN